MIRFSALVIITTLFMLGGSCTVLNSRTTKYEFPPSNMDESKLAFIIGDVKIVGNGLSGDSYRLLFVDSLKSSFQKEASSPVIIEDKGGKVPFDKQLTIEDVQLMSTITKSDFLLQFELNIWDSGDSLLKPDYNISFGMEVYDIYDGKKLGVVHIFGSGVEIKEPDEVLAITDTFAKRFYSFLLSMDEDAFVEENEYIF